MQKTVIALSRDGRALATILDFQSGLFVAQQGDALIKVKVTKNGHFNISLVDVRTGRGYAPDESCGQITQMLERAKVIQRAERLIREEKASAQTVRNHHQRLVKTLHEFDPFWPHWLLFCETMKVKI